MRVAGVCALSCALGICTAIGAQDAVSPEVLVIQEALKEQLSELRDAYPPLAAALAKQNDARAPAKLQQRLGEFEAFAKSITALEMQPEFVVIEQSSQTRMFSPSNRLSLFGGATTTIPAPAADEFFTGPNDEVAAHSGELRRVWIDASFPTRGGVGFELRRSYWSHEMYDGPLGKGWGHSYNQWIVGDVGESGELAGVEWHNEFRVVRFGRVGEHWIANDGSALKLEVDGNAIRIFTPELIRWNFESVSPLASEVPKSGKRLWRLVEVASRHGEWKANRLTLEYSKVGGQLIKVTDPFEMVFHFAYNDDGRLSQVTGPSTRVQYEFNEDGALIRTIVGKSAASGHSAYELSEEFGYTKIQGHALLQSTHRTGSASTTKYTIGSEGTPAEGRVIAAGVFGGADKVEWSWKWSPGQVEISRPAPNPVEELSFARGSGSHDSLPIARVIRSRGAKFAYKYSAQNRLIETTSPDGGISRWEYDESAIDPSMRGNLVRSVLVSCLVADSLAEYGSRTVYLDGTSFPVRREWFQIARGGSETILSIVESTYATADKNLVKQDSDGVLLYRNFNKFGEPVLLTDAKGQSDITYYAQQGLAAGAFEFQSGAVDGNGLAVRLIEDASVEQIDAAIKALNIQGLVARDKSCLPPLAIETRWCSDVHGRATRSIRDKHETLAVYNDAGQELAGFDSSAGVKLTEYDRAARRGATWHEFEPAIGGTSFEGSSQRGFSGKFFKESLSYDSLGRMASWSPTNEAFDLDGKSVIPMFRYERYEDGRMHRVTDPDGVTRVDEFSSPAGLRSKVAIIGGGMEVVLSHGYQYSAGVLKGFTDQFGGTWQYGHDGFGRLTVTTNPVGLINRTTIDGLGRAVKSDLEFVQSPGASLGRTQSNYGVYGLLRSQEVTRLIGSQETEQLTLAEFRYDTCGQLVAERSVREGAWSVFLLDGLKRRVGLADSGGTSEVTLFVGAQEVASRERYMNEVSTQHSTRGFVSCIDDRGFPWVAAPVDSKGKLAPTRAVVSHRNLNGAVNYHCAIGGDATVTRFDTRGQVSLEEHSETEARKGAETYVIERSYRPSGLLSETTRSNSALGIVKSPATSKLEPQRIECAQVSSVSYDALGRAVREIAPDGLQLAKVFHTSGLPERITWSHQSEPKVALRDLKLQYDKMGRITSIHETASNQLLREIGYDIYGNCTASTDYQGEDFVKVSRTFDSIGNVLSEDISTKDGSLPGSDFSIDLVKGSVTSQWRGLEVQDATQNWIRETRSADAASRLTAIALDGGARVNYQYIGPLPKRRTVGGVAKLTYDYTPMYEVASQRIYDVVGMDEFGLMEYGYGPDGQTEFENFKVAGHLSAQYFSTNPLRQLVAENHEPLIQFTPAESKARRSAVLDAETVGQGSTQLAAQNTNRMAYDQTGNMWLQFRGLSHASLAPDEFALDPTAVFASPATVIRDSPISSFDRQQLSSNRTATKASYQTDEGDFTTRDYQYDLLGNLVKFDGSYWNGRVKLPVIWELKYDPLGRLKFMASKLKEELGEFKKDHLCSELSFLYDMNNQRAIKQVVDHTDQKYASGRTATLYHAGNQAVVMEEQSSKGKWSLREQYLWGASERELVLGVVDKAHVGDDSDAGVGTYHFIQDRNLNVVAVARQAPDTGALQEFDTASYFGFGRNSTLGVISDISSDVGGANQHLAIDGVLDQPLSASWKVPGDGDHYVQLDTKSTIVADRLKIWADRSFPRDFIVFVLPPSVSGPGVGDVAEWTRDKQPVAVAKDGRCQGRYKTESISDPYEIGLWNTEGNKIVIVWEGTSGQEVDVREFELTVTPQNPSAIAYAGQWLDRETDLYYQVNRYRLAGENNFISPDPLGFAAGDNLYAYANNNPLEWHDPDGRFAHVLWGAGIGALLNSASYLLLDVWAGDAAFSWTTLGKQAAIGAAVGAVSAATFGLMNPGTAVAMNTSQWMASGAASGAAGGFTAGFGGVALDGGSMGAAMTAGFKGAAIGALGGAVGGASFGRMINSPSLLGLSGTAKGYATAALSGAAGGGAGGAIGGAMEAYSTGGDYLDHIGMGAMKGAAIGAGFSVAAVGAAHAVSGGGKLNWGNDRAEYWKGEAKSNPGDYSPENLGRMQGGRGAPQRVNPNTGALESQELHHQYIPQRAGMPSAIQNNRWNLRPVWPDEHRAIDSYRH